MGVIILMNDFLNDILMNDFLKDILLEMIVVIIWFSTYFIYSIIKFFKAKTMGKKIFYLVQFIFSLMIVIGVFYFINGILYDKS